MTLQQLFVGGLALAFITELIIRIYRRRHRPRQPKGGASGKRVS